MNTSPPDDQDRLIEGHEYDGIQELDNPLPGWWLTTFWLTIIFSVIYYGYYEFLGGPSSDKELNYSLAEVYQNRLAAESQRKMADPQQLQALLTDQEALARGEKVYIEKCAVCHAPDGGGLVGPNLTDAYWVHGQGEMPEIVKIVIKGVPEKGMQPWADLLSDQEIYEVSAYVKTLEGTIPKNPKEPQGNQVSR